MLQNPAEGSKVRIEDVARAAGVSNATVSLCMLGRPRVSAETRQRVFKAADKLGYRANQAASLLARQRAASGTGGARGVSIGFLNEMPSPAWAFEDLAKNFGVTGHTFRPSDFSSPESACRILQARGVQGLIISEQGMRWSKAERRRFSWDLFSGVKITRGMQDLPFHLVRHSAFDYMMATLCHVADRGYRDILVLITSSVSSSDDEARLGALLCFRHLYASKGVRVEWMELGPTVTVSPEVHAMIRKRAPDALVTLHWTTIYSLRAHNKGYLPPVAAVLSSPGVSYPDTPVVSGCDVAEETQVRRALTVLLELIGRGERGFPAQAMELVIQPAWVAGDTLPEYSRPSPAKKLRRTAGMPKRHGGFAR